MTVRSFRVPCPLSGGTGSPDMSASEKPRGPAIVRNEPKAGTEGRCCILKALVRVRSTAA